VILDRDTAEHEGTGHDFHRIAHEPRCCSSSFGKKCRHDDTLMRSEFDERRLSSPVRFTLASELDGDINGAWWPHTSSIARELPELIDGLRARLGPVVDIGLNWSPLEGVPELDLLNRRGVAATPGRESRHLRVMTVTGGLGRANLLVVPSRTSQTLAVMILRQAAALPIQYEHQQMPAYRAACDILTAARDQGAPSEAPADAGSLSGASQAALHPH
jgi:hypothetical protein